MIAFIAIMVVALVLLIVAEIKNVRFRWRLALICVVSCSYMGPIISNEIYKAETFRLYAVFRMIRDKVSQNDIQSVRNAFRSFDPSCNKLFEQNRALYDNLKGSAHTIHENHDMTCDETESPIGTRATDRVETFGAPLILKANEEKIP